MFNFNVEYQPIHPGEILKLEFLDDLDITQSQFAKDLGVTYATINEIVHGKRGISLEMAFKMGKYFNMSPEFWVNLQKQYEIFLFTYNEKNKKKLEKVKVLKIKELV